MTSLGISRLFVGFLTGSVSSIGLYKWYEYKNGQEEHTERLESENVEVVTGSNINVEYQEGDEQLAKQKKGEDILKFGMPDRGSVVQYYKNHVLSYDQERKIPLWVAEHITADMLQGKANRKYSRFHSDTQVAEPFRSHNSDYIGSGWSRGHMAPAGDNKYDQGAMDESFLLSNVVPQDIRNNGGFWNMFEIYCRDLTKKYSNVWVISGPAMVPTTDSDGKTIIKYQLIGKHKVAVPTHLYKVIVAEEDSKKPLALAAFLVPNIPISHNRKLSEFQVPLESLEGIVGLHFYPKLDRRRLFNLCEIEGCKLMDRNKFELYFIGRKLESATTLQRLDKAWAEIGKKNLTPDDYVIKLYNRRKVEIARSEAQKPES